MCKYNIKSLLFCLFCFLLQKNISSDKLSSDNYPRFQYKKKPIALILYGLAGWGIGELLRRKFLAQQYNNSKLSKYVFPHSRYSIFSLTGLVSEILGTLTGDKITYCIQKKSYEKKKQQFPIQILTQKKDQDQNLKEIVPSDTFENSDKEIDLIKEYIDTIQENKGIINSKFASLGKLIADEQSIVYKKNIFQNLFPEVFIESLKSDEINEENSHTLERMITLFKNVQKDKFDESDLELLKQYKKSLGLNFQFHAFLAHEVVKIKDNFLGLQENYNFNSKLLLFTNAHFIGIAGYIFPLFKADNAMEKSNLIAELNDHETLEKIIPFLKQAHHLMQEKINTKKGIQKAPNKGIFYLLENENINLKKYDFLDQSYYKELLNLLFTQCEIILLLLENSTPKSNEITEVLIKKLSTNFMILVEAIDKFSLTNISEGTIDASENLYRQIIVNLCLDEYSKISNYLINKTTGNDQKYIKNHKELLWTRLYPIIQNCYTDIIQKITDESNIYTDQLRRKNFRQDYEPGNEIGEKEYILLKQKSQIDYLIRIMDKLNCLTYKDNSKQDSIKDIVTLTELSIKLTNQHITFLENFLQNLQENISVKNKLSELKVKYLINNSKENLKEELITLKEKGLIKVPELSEESQKELNFSEEMIRISQGGIALLSENQIFDFQMLFDLNEFIIDINYYLDYSEDPIIIKNLILTFKELEKRLLYQIKQIIFSDDLKFLYAKLLETKNIIFGLQLKLGLELTDKDKTECQEYLDKYNQLTIPKKKVNNIILKVHFDGSSDEERDRATFEHIFYDKSASGRRSLISEKNLNKIKNSIGIK